MSHGRDLASERGRVYHPGMAQFVPPPLPHSEAGGEFGRQTNQEKIDRAKRDRQGHTLRRSGFWTRFLSRKEKTRVAVYHLGSIPPVWAGLHHSEPPEWAQVT